MARRRRKPRYSLPKGLFALAWWLTIGILKLGWWLLVGLAQGVWIGYYEARAKAILAKWRRKGISIYDTRIWRLLRRVTTAPYRYGGMVECQRCLMPTPTPHCHHIEEISECPELAFTPSNLTPLCPECHQAVHPGIPILQQVPPRLATRLLSGRRV